MHAKRNSLKLKFPHISKTTTALSFPEDFSAARSYSGIQIVQEKGARANPIPLITSNPREKYKKGTLLCHKELV